MVRIILIGAGNIGSRHLQALALLDRPADITVIDGNKAALALSRQRFEEVYNNSDNKKAEINVNYSADINSIPDDVELAIVATSSGARRAIVEQLVAIRPSLKYLILEKVLFQSTKDLYEVGSLLREHNIKTFVNCARRDYRHWHDIKEALKDEPYINMTCQGGDWGMACNGVHILDIFSFITGCSQFRADNSELVHEVFDSKRSGYVEFYGNERFYCKRGSLTLGAAKNGEVHNFITISADHHFYLIDEVKGNAEYRHAADGWQRHDMSLETMPVSRLTNTNVQNILDTGTCRLTPYDESVGIHECLLNSFLDHYNKVTGEDRTECPIT